MGSKIIQQSFEFKRRIDGAVYRFHPCKPINGQIAWKREDIDLWITRVERFGWVCIDSNKIIYGIPWCVELDKMGELPPAGEWISKKGDKSYVYDVTYIADP